jgi:cell wall integrity and stress response component
MLTYLLGSNIYQTLGLCNDSCQGKFTYAVLQYQECWCSNEKPSETVSVESCNQSCPGYPDQKCGNKGAGLFAYVPLDGAPVSGGGQANSTVSIPVSQAQTSNLCSCIVDWHTNCASRCHQPDLRLLPLLSRTQPCLPLQQPRTAPQLARMATALHQTPLSLRPTLATPTASWSLVAPLL